MKVQKEPIKYRLFFIVDVLYSKKGRDFMIGVLVNSLAIILGGAIGLIFKKGLNDQIKKIVLQSIGLGVLMIGFLDAIKTENVLLLVFSLVIGGVIGTIIGIETRLSKTGESIEAKFKSNDSFAKGFVVATLVYVVGAMAVMGSIEAGISQSYETLFIKSLLDGVTAIIFASTLGVGVLFSSVPVFIYQGLIVLLATWIEPYLTDSMTLELSAVGGVIIFGIGLNLLEIKTIKVGDLVPAIFIPIIYMLVFV
jgi:uncharacterized membrane protein YqgA involved in biofilm formation